jgi:hypothetical protein
MASYPSSIYSPVTKENKNGVTYDPSKTTVGFAEDFNYPNAEIVAVETELGTLPKGSKASVKARLDDVDSRIDDHSARHENGGADEISVAGLSGELADAQTPKAHKSSHAAGGSDALLESDIGVLHDISFIIDGGGSAITTGQKGHLEIPFKCEIQRVTLLADQSGSIVIDIWKDTYANFPPTVADTITASAKPTLSSAQKYQDATLTGWTKTINAGDILAFNVDSAATLTRVTLSLKVKIVA